MIEQLIKREHLEDDYVVASNKIYIIGSQDGTFKKLGFHVEGEMGGIIAQPIKIADGYRLFIDDEKLIANQYSFDNGQSVFTYEMPAGTLERREYAIANEKVAAVALKPNFTKPQTLKVVVDFHVMGCWTAQDCGFKQGDTVLVEENNQQVIVKNEYTPNFAGVFTNKVCSVSSVKDENRVQATLIFENMTDEPVELMFISNNESQEAILEKYKEMVANKQNLQDAQKAHLEKIFAQSHLTTNDKAFDLAFEALKLNYEMLIQDIDGVGEGYTAGYPDYPWFFGCDTTYGINGTLTVGHHEMTLQTLRLLKKLSWDCNENGRVIHEISPFGYVYNKGNLQETPHFISAVYEAYKWTGDRAFLEEMYDFCKQGMVWVEGKAKDGYICPKGAGIVEIDGVDGRLIDIAMTTYHAYGALEKMAHIFGEEEQAAEYSKKAKLLSQEIKEKFYSEEEQFFGDIICTKAEIEASKDTLINNIKNTKTQHEALKVYFNKLLSKTYEENELIPVALKNWICMLPYTEDFLTEEMRKAGLEEMKKPNFYNESGMKLGCLCDDAKDPVEDMYTVNKSMSINTGYLAEVFARNAEPDRGYDLLKKLTDCVMVGMPSAISEILPNDGCFMQFWSGYGIHYVFVKYLLGIDVDAPAKKITIKPNLPQHLNDVTLKQLRVGEAYYDITFKVEDGQTVVQVDVDRADYTFEIL